MKTFFFGLLLMLSTQSSFAQSPSVEKEIIQLSKDKWQLMADKNENKLMLP